MPTYDIAKARRWDIAVLPFPYSDRFAEKRRPALVISGDALHRRYQLLWVAMITSATDSSWACDVPITDLKRAGLPAPSVVRPVKIACIDPARVLRAAGALVDADISRVEHELTILLGRS